MQHSQISARQKRANRRTISMRLNEIAENELKRIARVLHDHLGQELTALNINLDVIKCLLEDGQTELALRKLGDSSQIIQQSTEHLRDLMTDLQPPALDDYGLLETMRWYAEEFSQRTGLLVNVSGDEPDPELPEYLALPLFRIAQEALNNVEKHAQAKRVVIVISDEGEMIHLSISDDGIGFHQDQISESDNISGWGLWVICQRAESIGGTIQIHSHPGKGAHLSIKVMR